ncbi:hypothetical protein K7H22_08005 [Seohaeicola saemankumensis]|uniref:hypothetical protein n=1 Tax=Seohaeicola saemankumensis TaxID=481181 RepID=UPI001E581448|nr:hypothetical protein [Seohaeicola saemankumensis]MCD1625929.1 hypothetical protein [Seohaeicola saemankumensis]
MLDKHPDIVPAVAGLVRARLTARALAGEEGNLLWDSGLKLLVIEGVMYRRSLLGPRFDRHAFAACIIGAGRVIGPVQRCLDGGLADMQHLHRFWDSGAGDMPTNITAKAIDDLALLPALKRITGFEISAPGAKLRAAL